MKLKENGKYIISLRCKDSKFHVIGSEKRPCTLCGEPTWVSPALQKHKIDGVLCTRCIKEDDLKCAKIDMKVQAEVLRQIGNRQKITAG